MNEIHLIAVWQFYHCNHAQLTFGSWVPPLGPHRPGTQLLRFRFPYPVTAVPIAWTGVQRRTITELFKDARAPPAVRIKAMSSGPSQWEWVGLKWQTHSEIPVSLSLWIPSSPFNQDGLGVSNSLTVGHILVLVSAQQPNKLLEPFLTPWAATLNPESLFSEPVLLITVQLYISNTIIPYPYYPFPHMFSAFCLYKLENSSSSFEELLLMGLTLYLKFRDLQWLLSSYRSRSKTGCWPWVMRRISSVLHGICLRGDQYSLVPQTQV